MKPTVFSAVQVRRAFSTNNSFVTQRSKYQAELSGLRKVWQNEFELKQKLEQESKDAEKKRVIIERAVKLREQRKESKAKQELVLKQREEAFLRYKEKLAATHLLWEEKQALRKVRQQKVVQDLNNESSVWISAENIDDRITDDLFSKVSATTGYSTKYSNLWKYQVFTPKLERILSDEFQQKMHTTALMDKLRATSQYRVAKRVSVESFLDQIIGTGKERNDFKKLVNDVTQTFENFEAFEDLKEHFEDSPSSTENA